MAIRKNKYFLWSPQLKSKGVLIEKQVLYHGRVGIHYLVESTIASLLSAINSVVYSLI